MSTYIVALGARTPVGLTAEAAAAAVRAGISRVRLHPVLLDRGGEPVRCAADARLDPASPVTARLETLALAAWIGLTARLAPLPTPGGLFLAVPEVRPGFTAEDERRLVERLAARTGIPVVVAGRGHAGALQAIEAARAHVAAGNVELCAAGGVDSYLDRATFAGLMARGQLACSETRSGLVPGEAAGLVAITSHRLARHHRVPMLAHVSPAQVTHEHAVLGGEDEVLGHGLAEAITRACAAASVPVAATVYGDINGERYRTDEWGFVALRASHCLADPAGYVAPVDLWGDVGAATGALLAILACQAWARGYARGKNALLFGGSLSGMRAAMILQQVES